MSAASGDHLDIGAAARPRPGPRRRSGGTGGGGPSAAARSGTSGRRRRASAAAAAQPVGQKARQMPAVYSGRRVSNFAAAIRERVHLLGDDVGRLADRAGEHLGELEDRRRHLAIAIESATSRAVSTTSARRRISSGRRSWVPRTGCSLVMRNRLELSSKERKHEAATRRRRDVGRLGRLGRLDLRRLLLDQPNQMIDDVGVLQAMSGTPAR